MTISDYITMSFILFVFGGASALFTFIALKSIRKSLKDRGFFIKFKE